MRILYVTAVKPTLPNGMARFESKLSAYVGAGAQVGVVCGVEPGDAPAPIEGVEFFPVEVKASRLPFSIVDALDEAPVASVHDAKQVADVRAALEELFGERLDAVIGSFRPDVIICTHLTLMTSIVLDHAAGIPVAALNHSICLHKFLDNEPTRQIIVDNVRRLELIFACYGAQRDLLVDELGADASKVKVLTGGCDTSVFTMDGHREYRSSDAPQIDLVFTGKYTYKNGLGSLMNAVALLPCRPDTVNLRLCGKAENSFQKAALELSMRENPQNIIDCGYLSRDRVAEEYRRAQVFVSPAFYDELPLKILEALACECKVVVTEVPGMRLWIEENVPGASVFYVEPPRMQGLDEPLKCDLADFEQRMSDAIKQAVLAPLRPVDVSRLSWGKRIGCIVAECAKIVDKES